MTTTLNDVDPSKRRGVASTPEEAAAMAAALFGIFHTGIVFGARPADRLARYTRPVLVGLR